MSDNRITEYLVELYRQTEGDLGQQVSMHEVGASIGMDKNEAGSLAEDLIMEDLVELKTLAGGVGITVKGIDSLQQSGLIAVSSAVNVEKLSGEEILTAEDRDVVQGINEEIKKGLSQAKTDYALIEQIVIDLKTIEVQLLSTQPKKSVIVAVFHSLQGSIEKLPLAEVSEKLKSMIS